MKNIILTVLSLLFGLTISSFGQSNDTCGAVPGEMYLDHLISSLGAREELINQYYQERSSARTTSISIPVQFHVTRTDDGENQAVSDVNILSVLDNLNAAYAPMNMTFMACGQTKFIDNTSLHTNFKKDTDDTMLDQYDDKFVLNFYLVGNLDGLNGYAKFPQDQIDRVVVEAENALTSTVIHEVGHYFSLLHTYSTSRGIELVDGSNCLVSGDLICDTPPDPGERDYFSNCTYVGTVTDPEGRAYAPDGFNYMGKGENTCRNRFSTMQQQRILASAMMDRYYLVDCSQTEPTITCTNTIESFPYEESFEDYAGGTAWKQNIDDQFGWEVGASTPSSDTGPDQAKDGNYFMFTESSDYQNATGIITGPCFNLQNQSASEISFSYHMFGVDIGKLELQIDQDESGTWTTIWGQQGNKGDQWLEATVSLNQYLGSTVQLRFSARTAGGSKGDIALDEVVVSDGTVLASVGGESINEDRLILYPNPVSETMTIQYKRAFLVRQTLLITSIDGRTMYNEPLDNLNTSGELRLDVSRWSAGTYIVRMTGQTGDQTTTFVRQP
ncbi:T9SS type A sorting domain-containing protein [Reichenbachiella sp.]|uniref:T9SS type A sorting domain-containing protein n=1 Tax=Reichenbachiella sp. TaxID=2184521 RepID=UPI003299A4DD